MEKVKFTDPETQEVVEFVVEDETQLNGVKYLSIFLKYLWYAFRYTYVVIPSNGAK